MKHIKKLAAVLIAVCMLFTFSGCGFNESRAREKAMDYYKVQIYDGITHAISFSTLKWAMDIATKNLNSNTSDREYSYKIDYSQGSYFPVFIVNYKENILSSQIIYIAVELSNSNYCVAKGIGSITTEAEWFIAIPF